MIHVMFLWEAVGSVRLLVLCPRLASGSTTVNVSMKQKQHQPRVLQAEKLLVVLMLCDEGL